MATIIECLDGSKATTRGAIGIVETDEGLIINTSNKISQRYLAQWRNQMVVGITGSEISEIVGVTGQKGLKQISYIQPVKLTEVL